MEAAHFWNLVGFSLNLGGAVVCAIVAAWLAGRRESPRRERRAAILALTLTSAWCVTSAAWGAGNHIAELIESPRNLAWILVLYRLFANDGRDQSLAPIRPLILTLALVECVQPGLVILDARLGEVPAVHAVAFSVSSMLRALVAAGALVLLHNLYAGASAVSRQVLRWPAASLALLWTWHLTLYTLGWFTGDLPSELLAVRGLVAAGMAVLFAIGANARAADLRMAPSRAVAFQSLSVLVIGAYVIAMFLLAQSLSLVGGSLGRLTQVAFVFAAATVAALWLPSKHLRAWLRVNAFKHLFQHRYDYRAEWLRFTGTIGRAGPDAPPLPERAAQALADLTDSQGAVLFLPNDGDEGMALAGRWQWDDLAVPACPGTPELAAALERTGSIVELDAIRQGDDHGDIRSTVPQWLLDDRQAWVILPLIHFSRLAGIAVLARPTVARRIDWEDIDLLKVVGRQLASYIAEQAGHEALVEAARFDEFNRRIAFVVHDIKNLASQLSLLARNAERHADNPAFRADMLVTLTKSAEKLNTLLARLGRYGANARASREAVDLLAVARQISERYEGVHRVELTRSHPCLVAADAEALEQALVHLVQNAIEASPADCPVLLDVTSDGLHGRIEVVDSGSGMTPQFVRDKLFRPFVSSKDGGFGIGAFEARELVRAMGGRLDVESREGLGSRFAATFPLSAVAPASGDAISQDEVA